mmetsp:Transcript_92446/g.270612  ORF Transcript_92446/g.270612 Transcript_92446/m.270612 type:complete len:512 (+) Transcript_92446:87-1622(+)
MGKLRAACWKVPLIGACPLVVIVAHLLASDDCSGNSSCSPPEGWEHAFCHNGKCFANKRDDRCQGQTNGHQLGDGTWCWDGGAVTGGVMRKGALGLVRDGSTAVLQRLWGRYAAALPVILKMRLMVSDKAAQVQGCGIFSDFGWNDPQSKSVMLTMGAIDAAIAALKFHKGDASVEGPCYNGIAALSLYNREVSLRVGELGGVEMTLDYWRRNFDNPRAVVANYFGCYQDFAPENRARMRAAGAIRLMFEACGEGGRHFWDAQAQFSVWCGFSSFHTKENHEEFARQGGARHTYVVFRDHAKSYRVREEILQATKGVCAHRSVREELAKEGFFELLAGAVREEAKDPQIQALGLETLRTFVDSNATLRAGLVAEGGIGMALRALDVHAPSLLDTRASWDSQNVYGSLNDDQYNVPGAAAEILYSMALEPDARKSMIEANAVQRIDAAIKATSNRIPSVMARTRRAGCQALRLLRSEAPAEASAALGRNGCPDRDEHPVVIVNGDTGIEFEP